MVGAFPRGGIAMNRGARAIAIWAAAVGVAACDEPFELPPPPPPPPPVAAVHVAPDSGAVVAGETLQLTVSLQDSTGATLTRAVSWSSLDTMTVRVSATGAARGVNAGLGAIVATSEGKADTAKVLVLPVTFVAVTAGGTHTCALANNQRAFCWGYNFYGQTGSGTFAFVFASPVVTAGGQTFAAVSAGGDHSCALAPAGALYCWGRNTSSQLGLQGVSGNQSTPQLVVGSLVFTVASAGGYHTCGVAADSSGYCWGHNTQGQAGDGSQTFHSAPHTVSGGHRFRAISGGGFHTCAVTVADAVFCWGVNVVGQLGDSTQFARSIPTRVNGGPSFLTVTAGEDHSCGIAGDSTAWCWGANARGEVGSGQVDSVVPAPAAVSGGVTYRMVDAGAYHTCGIAADSSAVCWGINDRGQLGDSSTTDRPVPTPVAGGHKFVQISAGFRHTCGAATDGRVYCWGAGTSGELGTGLLNDSSIPVVVAGQP
jgi:alpha-tubulin suppressor-like RCC1 family protein